MINYPTFTSMLKFIIRACKTRLNAVNVIIYHLGPFSPKNGLTLYQAGGLFGPRLSLILNNFFSTKPIKLQLSVPS